MNSPSYLIPFLSPKGTVKDIERFLEEVSLYCDKETAIKHCPIHLSYCRDTDPIKYLDLLDRYSPCSWIRITSKNDVYTMYITTTLKTILDNGWEADLYYIVDNLKENFILTTYIIDYSFKSPKIDQPYASLIKSDKDRVRILYTSSKDTFDTDVAMIAQNMLNQADEGL